MVRISYVALMKLWNFTSRALRQEVLNLHRFQFNLVKVRWKEAWELNEISET